MSTTKNNQQTFFNGLVCSSCGKPHNHLVMQNVCQDETCKKPLLAVYDFSRPLDKKILLGRINSMWRYREMLPVISDENIITLGEGMTPLLKANRLGKMLAIKNLYIKDESHNPTGSFKSRGLGMAVSKCVEFGIKKCAAPTAGNAGGALAAYCAKAGIEAHVFMPMITPQVFKKECEFFNAQLTLVEGLISDCGKIVAERKEKEGWLDVSTLKEPYRVEGKKTMGYEIAEQMRWELPDVIIYPIGGGTGLIGMWKAFDEMERLGWISSARPRMVVVQSNTCAPVVDAFKKGKKEMEFFTGAHTLASGLCVPKPYADQLILEILAKSKGGAVTVTDDEIINGIKEVSKNEGLFIAPEGGAVYAALLNMIADKSIGLNERIVLLNTGSAYKYLENIC